MAASDHVTARPPSPAREGVDQSSPSLESLCAWCRQWNWQAIFNRPVEDARPLFRSSMAEQHIGPSQPSRELEDLLSNERCSLCTIVLAGLTEHGDFARMLGSPRGLWLWYSLEPAQAPYDSGAYYLQDVRAEFMCIYRLRVDVWNTPIHCRIQRFLGETEPASLQVLRGRKLQDVLNEGLLRTWLETCDSKHGCMAQVPSPNTDLRATIWMIDVRQKMIVRWIGDESKKPYAALSYVWGDSKTSQLKHGVGNGNAELFQKPGGIFQADVEVPLTIRDAMELCDRLQLQYLWVDSICICQDRPAADELASMSYIYGCAYVTIACVDGDSSRSGLPGVRLGSRTHSSSVSEVDGIYLGLARRPVSKIQSGIWNTRAWTYQELVLSRRVLYFCSDEVVFCCNDNVQWRESMHLEALLSPDNEKTPGLHAHFSDAKFHQFSTHHSDRTPNCKPKADVTISEYEIHLRHFVSRNITRLKDRLRAFQGIIDTYQPILGNEWFQGLPIKNFHQALTFKYQEPVPAEPEHLFPSWAWAHWRGITEFGYWAPSAHRIFARNIFYRLNTVHISDTDDAEVIVNFHAIDGPEDEGARELLNQNTMHDFTWTLSSRAKADLEKLLVFNTQFLRILVARSGEGTIENTSYQFFDIIDPRFPRNAFRDASSRICLSTHWRSEQPDYLEFVMVCGQKMAGLSRVRNFVVAFLVDTDEHDFSRRVNMVHIREDVWNAAKPDWRWVLLC